jgi:hypothetical protein
VTAAEDGFGNQLPRKRPEEIPVFSAGEAGFEARPAIHAPSIALQAKLRIGKTDDPLEHEANRVAAEVMRAPSSHVFIGQVPPQISRKTVLSSRAGPESRLSAAQNSGGAAPGIVHQALRAPGQPMDAETRAFMEPRFGRDFGHIRIHADSTAARSAKEINARAYTAGNNIAFAEGQFAPHSAGGRSLLAHELAHTVQQGGQPQLIQRSADKDDDDSAPSKPRDATVTQNTQGNKVIYREQLNRGREHALLVRTMDFGTFPPAVQVRLYRGQELPSLRGNKMEISWVDVTKEAQRNGPVSVDWNMPALDTDDKGKQQEKDREIADQQPNPVLSLLIPASNAYVKDRSSEIHDPLKRSQYRIDRQGIEAGTNLGRATGAAVADAAAAASLAPAAAELVTAAAPEALYAARYAYLNAPSIYASGLLYSGAAMTGAALAAHVQKIRSKGFDSSDIPQLAEDLMPAVGGYLDAQSFNTSAPNGKPSGETAEADFVITRPPQYDPQTKRISGTLARPGGGGTFDAEFDPVTGNGQIIERASRRVVGIIRNGEIKAPAAALPAGQSDPSAPAVSPVAPRPPDVRPPVTQPAAASAGTARPVGKATTQREMDELAAQQKQTTSAKNDKGPPLKGKASDPSEELAAKGGKSGSSAGAAPAAEPVVTTTPESYRAVDPANKQLVAVGYLREGELELHIRAQTDAGVRGSIRGAEQFKKIIDYFGLEKIRSIKGSWSFGDNLSAFNKAIAALPPAERTTPQAQSAAAAATWTGKQAKEVGFTVAHVTRAYGEPGKYDKVEVSYTRP